MQYSVSTDFFDPCQSGFRPRYGTETEQIQMADDLLIDIGVLPTSQLDVVRMDGEWDHTYLAGPT